MDDRTEQLLEQIEAKFRELKEYLRVPQEPSRIRWARQMVSVLAEVQRRGGNVSKDELLEIGERSGYQRQGMAGFYQLLLRAADGRAILTPEGHSRLESLRRQYSEL